MKRLRAFAASHNFSQPLPLAGALERLGFVQADPIRSPARAQDLILRQRVPGYRAGQLEAAYPELDCEEDFLYAYGFLPRATWRLVHPRKPGALKAIERRAFDAVMDLGVAHPSDVAARLGRRAAVNGWGGRSTASTRALHRLHACGLIRVAHRDNGTRVYAAPRTREHDEEPISPPERLRRIVTLVARIFAPVPEPSLRQILNHLTYCHVPPSKTRPVLAAMLKSGEMVRENVQGVDYVWPAGLNADAALDDASPRVRILAPFDPLVWDRRRFEHLWGWTYRFEAYTPAPKRKLGYYAMPMLWGDHVVGWANAALVDDGRLAVEAGFAVEAPRGRDFRRALDEEIESLTASLGARR